MAIDVTVSGLNTVVDVEFAESPSDIPPETYIALRGEKGDTGDAGQDGVDGADGFSPIATVSKVGDTATISITDLNGTTTANISDGTDGVDGTDGADGYSPTATVTKSGDTATITITDINGTTTATVKDGTQANAFTAEYGTTTYADVKGAYDDDAIIICTADDSGNTKIFQLAYFDDGNNIFYFAEPTGDGWDIASVSENDGWDSGIIQFASTDTATQLRDGLMSALDKQKLDGIASGAEVNVQSDWNQSVNTADDYIKNKPSIPTITDTYSGTSSDGMSGKAVKSAIDALDGIISGSAGSGKTLTAFSQTDGKVSATFGNISITKSQVSDFPSLATVATSGDYDDLTDKPAIHNVPSGGTSGQVLAKDSNDDYDLTWVNQSGGGGGEIVYCTCTDSASTVAKTATVVSGTFASLDTGSQVAVKFTYTNTATNPTLNVAGTGAKGIRRGGTAYVGTNANESWNAGTVVFLLYDGVDWQIVGWLNTTYNGGTGTEIVAGTSALNKVWSPQQINYGIDGMSTATPTASKISKFDSSAHMNSTDMTSQEVSDFVDALDGQGANLADYVVEQGTSGIWTYRKWNSGIAECWGTHTQTTSHYTTALGGYAYISATINFPSNLFIDIPIVTYSGRIGGGFVLTGTQTNNLTKDNTVLYAIATASGSQTCYWYIRVIGRWK